MSETAADRKILTDLVIRQVVSCSDMYTDTNTCNTRKNRSHWAIILKYEGSTVYTSNGKTCFSDANNPVILPKGSSYTWKCMEKGHYAVIEFDAETEYGNILSFHIRDNTRMLKKMKDAEYKMTAKKDGYKLDGMKTVYEIILELLNSEKQKYVPGKKQEKLSPAMEMIIKNQDSEISNSALAKAAGMSTVYFRKLFTEVYGVSPMTYVRNFKIRKAMKMLESDYGNITDVATALGYVSIYDFSRTFKKCAGMSPSKYAKVRNKSNS